MNNQRTHNLKLIAAISLGAILWAGCASTVVPVKVGAQRASWDGKDQNSGFLSFLPDGALITPHARDRYNSLVEIYGKRFTPPIGADAGIIPDPQGNPNAWKIDNEHLAKFATMNRWRKEGK